MYAYKIDKKRRKQKTMKFFFCWTHRTFRDGLSNAYTIDGDVDFRSRRNLFG